MKLALAALSFLVGVVLAGVTMVGYTEHADVLKLAGLILAVVIFGIIIPGHLLLSRK